MTRANPFFRRASLLAAAAFGLAGAAHGQATIDNGSATAAQMAARLEGPGVTFSNAEIPAANNSDAADMYGLFSNGIAGAGLMIDSGAALSTGRISEMFTSNSAANASIGGTTTYSDPDLTAIEAGATRNVAVMTMDVTLAPYVTGIRMRYQFGSDEYPDYAGSTFNDLFAILVSGPGITGNENIALTPSGGRTDVNTVNYGIRGCAADSGSFSALDSGSYIRNGHTTSVNGSTGRLNCNPATQPGPFPVTMEWNGLTTALTAERTGLTSGATYQLKIAVADVLDQQYDSGAVFEYVEGTYSRDYGDAPNTGGYGNPYHYVRSDLRLGASVTTETNGYNSPAASADSGDDGAVFPVMTAGSSHTVFVSVQGGAGYLQAFADWNQDGDFDDAGEQVAVDAQDTDNDGYIPVTLTPPASATAYNTFVRLRWSSQAGLGAAAEAPDGEVEDYQVLVQPPTAIYACPAGYSPLVGGGYGVAIISTPPGATNPNNALGAPLTAGSALSAANSARLTSTTTTLGLDLGAIVPQNAPVILSIARDDNAGAMAIDTSVDGSTWTQRLTFNSPTNDVAQHVTLTSPAGGVRYLRFRRTGGNLWIDGVQRGHYCAAQAQLAGSKSITVYDPAASGLYALPGNDVIYALTVANTGAVAADTNSVVLIDRIPSELEVFNGPTPEFGGGVVAWTQTGTGLSFSAATDLAWSNAAAPPGSFGACTYVPIPGYDPAARYICLNPKGTMAAGTPDPEFTVRFRARIR